MRYALLTAILVAMASAGSAAANGPSNLDLICSGRSVDAGGVSTPFADRISVDLKAKRWCDRQANCPYVFPIRAQHGAALQLLAVKTPLNEANFDVDLQTGAFTRSSRIPDRPESPASAKGICTAAPFTPFN